MSTPSRPIRSAALGIAAAMAGGIGATAWYAKKHEFQSPLFLARYLMTPHSLVGPLFALRTMRRADVPIETPQQLTPIDQVVNWKGNHQGLRQVLEMTNTNTFLVAKDGVIVHEWSRKGYTTATPQSSWSVAKSIVGLVTGQVIADGLLTEDTRIIDVLPEFSTGGPFDTITVGHLLDMRSGIDLAEEYKEWQAYTGVGGMMTTKNLPAYLMRSRSTFAVPGTISDYRSVDTQFLSMMLARVEGQSLSAVVRKRLWNELGTLDNATWALDHENGLEKGFMGVNASSRDYLKVGLLVQNRGRVGDKQVVPEAWIDRVSTPIGIVQGEQYDWGYGACWWHPTGHEEHEDMTALGVYGQYVYVNRAKKVVITKQSDHGTSEDEEALIGVYRELATTLT